ncbi:hypothetical protein HZC27_00430 [Candidatus Roizmanbacteria bacterium]|nr:hypothetical protein [Candidatus Roizmanbacteria bacterium]
MTKKKIIIILSVLLLLMGLQMIFAPVLRRLPFLTGMVPLLPTPAEPVNSLSGVLDSKGFNNITVVTYNKAYKVKITDKTVITGQIPMLPRALLSLTSGQPKKIGFNDLKDGQGISVNTLVDLRDQKINEFEATAVSSTQVVTTLGGTLVDKKGNDIFVKAAAFAASSPSFQTYTVKTNKNTGFFMELKKISLNDLKKNSQIIVYSNGEITGREDINAQYIEVLPPPPLPPTLAPEGR